MKPFLGIDLTTDKKNEQLNGGNFMTHKPSLALSDSLKSSTEQADTTIKRSKLPQPFRILQYISGIIALLFIGGILKADISLAEGYRNAPWVYWGAGICAVVWFLLWVWSKLKSKTVLGTEESTRTFSNLEGISNAIYTELAVPADAKEVDILSFFYKVKEGKIKVCEKGLQMAPYLNPAYRIFADSENLYLANLEGKYTLPLSSVVSLHTIKKHIRIIRWNKEASCQEGCYKQYKITTDQYGCVHCRHYHILEINHHGEKYGVYIPCYELPVFEELTGLKAQQQV